MYVPYSFVKDLSLINPKYFANYDEMSGTWIIRKWLGAYPRPRTVETDSKIICIVPYPMLDERILSKIRRGLYFAQKTKELIQKIDESNARLVEQADVETEYVSRYMAKDIYRHYREPRMVGGVSGGARSWKY